MNNTVDAQADEIEKFAKLADRWWDREGEFKPLHEINPLRTDWIERHRHVRGARILDIGCGGGLLAEALARRGGQVLGIDLADASLAVAREHAAGEHLDIEYRLITAEQLAGEQPGEFDVVTCLETLEHVPDYGAIVKAAAALVKPEGKVFFSTINRNARSWLHAIIGAEYVLRLLPRGTHDHHRFIKPAELDACCRSVRLELEAMTGLGYNPLRQRYRLDADVSVNYMSCYRRATGGH